MDDKKIADFMNFISNVGSVGQKKKKVHSEANYSTSSQTTTRKYSSYYSPGASSDYKDYNTDYSSYTPYTDYSSYTPYTDYSSYTSYTDYSSYTPYTDYSSYTPYTDYSSYTEYYNDYSMHGSYQTYYGYGYS